LTEVKYPPMNNHDALPYNLDRLPDAEAVARADALAERLKQRRTCRDFSGEACHVP